jgi:hypothetical protein
VDLRKEAIEHHAPIKAATHAAHKAACDAEAKILKPIEEAERLVKRVISDWNTEQQRIQRERERLAREEAERIRMEEIEAAAVEAESQGASVEEVTAIIEQPMVAAYVAPAPTYQKAKGVSAAEIWSAEVFDMKALCLAIAQGKVSVQYVSPNHTALNQRARAEKQTMTIPGVRAVPQSSVRIGGR